KVTDKIYVNITAYFDGNDKYLPSENKISGLIIRGKTSVQELFETRFKKMTFEDIIFVENVNLGTLTIMILKAGKIVAEDMEITSLGLSSKNVVLNDIEVYLTYLTGQVEGVSINFNDFKEYTRLKKTITIENGLIMFTNLRCREADFYNLLIVGEHIEGEEPYIPLIITGKETVLSGGYRLDAPRTYGELVNKAMELRSGKIEVRNFSMLKPISYQLDRNSKKYQYVNRLSLNSSKVIGENITVYSIYYKVAFRIMRYFPREYILEATGDKDIRKSVLHFWIGWEIGRLCHSIIYTEIHITFLKYDKCLMENLTMYANSPINSNLQS
ncbi:MAG: hypothetical protein RMI79_06145, partial [Nitrososphaerota archaeon]|nr:hypothetical protein [Candidatus Aenigmarchaeota archaeon]MDW8034490.1 hypothetical protein [Nitrososphaerota archaeon]